MAHRKRPDDLPENGNKSYRTALSENELAQTQKSPYLQRDEHGVPLAESKPDSRLLPHDRPSSEVTKYLPDGAYTAEMTVTQVEVLMMKGVTEVSALCGLLHVPENTMRRYIERVHARWQVRGSKSNQKRVRGEALARLDLIEKELWGLLDNPVHPSVKLMALKQVQDLLDRRLTLHGLTPRVLETLDQTFGHDEEAEALQEQARMTTLAKHLLDYMRAFGEEHAASSLDAYLTATPANEVLDGTGLDDDES